MKKILLAFLLLSSFANLYAQELEGKWYLEKLVLDGEEILSPMNTEIEQIQMEIYFEFDIHVFQTSVCSTIINGSGVFFDDNVLMIDGYDYNENECDIPSNTIFDNQYFSIYNDDTDANYDYVYNVKPNGDSELVITNEFGNQLFYSNRSLGVQVNNSIEVSIFPNPVESTLNIVANQPIDNVRIYDVIGRVLLDRSTSMTIDLESIPRGIYYLQINRGNEQKTMSFIKK